MGVRGEVFSTKVALKNRTYFFNVKENRLGDLYLNIVESKNRDEGGFERQSVILFVEDLQDFLGGFDDALRVLEKSAREKKRGAPPARQPRFQDAPDKDPYPAPSRPRTPRRTDSRDDSRPPAPRRTGSKKPDSRSSFSHSPDSRDRKKPGARSTEGRYAEKHYSETRHGTARKDNRKGNDREQNYSRPGPAKKKVVVRKRRGDS